MRISNEEIDGLLSYLVEARLQNSPIEVRLTPQYSPRVIVFDTEIQSATFHLAIRRGEREDTADPEDRDWQHLEVPF